LTEICGSRRERERETERERQRASGDREAAGASPPASKKGIARRSSVARAFSVAITERSGLHREQNFAIATVTHSAVSRELDNVWIGVI
jgi:hypothetical protein